MKQRHDRDTKQRQRDRDAFLDRMYATLLAEIGQREPGRTFSQSKFQRRHRIGFVTVGALFDRAIAERHLDVSNGLRSVTYRIPADAVETVEEQL